MEEEVFMTESVGLIDWVNNYGNVVYFFGQVLFWLGMLLFVGYAVYQYKRWVNFQLGIGKSGALRTKGADDAATSSSAEKVSVDQFVE